MTKIILIFAAISIGCGSDPTGPSNEVIEWRKTLGEGWGNSVQQTVDGGFIVAGEYFDGSFRTFLLMTDGSGNEQWRKNFGEGWGRSVQQTVDGGFVITGIDGDYDRYGVLLFKTNELGYTDDLVDE